ncbi:MAG: NosD domain-containing protein, partial [Candidatus Thermoplasmatota archaeon]|nr:NosD domain-containing protein [Candidatus Thermoplasmatota archaeon]
RSMDGVNFEFHQRLNDDAGTVFQDNAAIAYDEATGYLYVVWEDYRSTTSYDIYLARSTDQGESFDSNVLVNSDYTSANQQHPSIAVGPDSTVYVAWSDYRTTDSEIYFARSTNYGASFGASTRVNSQQLASDQTRPSVATSGDNVYFVWQDIRSGNLDIYFRNWTLATGFGLEKVVNDDGAGASQYFPKVAASDDYVFVAWGDTRLSSTNIYFSRSINRGGSFDPNIRLDDAPGGSQNYVSIGLGNSGEVYVAWQDERDGAANKRISYTASENQGESFGTNKRFTSDSGSKSNPSIGYVSYKGNLYCAWGDNRNDASDIYFARYIDSTTIQGGVDIARPLWTVNVEAGYYSELVSIGKKISLLGAGSSVTTIENTTGDVVTITSTEGVLIKDFTITGSGFSNIYIGSSNYCRIEQNVISSNYEGISLDSASHNTIKGNQIESNDRGISIIFSISNVITANQIAYNYDGLYLYSTNSNVVTENKIEYNSNRGIYLTDASTSNLFYNNNFIGNTQHAQDINTNYWDNGDPAMGGDGGNHWDTHTWPDSNGDGIVDDEYYVPGSTGIDYYPWVRQNGWETTSSENRVVNIDTGLTYSTIQSAIDAANWWDTIQVWGGDYYENVVIDRPLNLVGNGSDTTAIHGSGQTVIYVSSAERISVNISGFYISGALDADQAGIYLSSNANNCTIEDNFLRDNNRNILLEQSENNTIRHNIIDYSSSFGIYVSLLSRDNQIYWNTIKNSGIWGIFISYSSNNSVYQNNFIANTNPSGGHAGEDPKVGYNNVWNKSYYEGGGNYWDDHSGIDMYTGPDQDVEGSDGIIDTPKSDILHHNSVDNYPWAMQNGWYGIDYIRIAQSSSGRNILEDHGMPTGFSIGGYAAGFNDSVGFVKNVDADWSVTTSGSGEAYILLQISTLNYNGVQLSYARNTSGLSSGAMLVEYSVNLGAWEALETVSASNYALKQFGLTGADNQVDVRIRWRLDGAGLGNLSWVDEVYVLGTPSFSFTSSDHVYLVGAASTMVGGGMKRVTPVQEMNVTNFIDHSGRGHNLQTWSLASNPSSETILLTRQLGGGWTVFGSVSGLQTQLLFPGGYIMDSGANSGKVTLNLVEMGAQQWDNVSFQIARTGWYDSNSTVSPGDTDIDAPMDMVPSGRILLTAHGGPGTGWSGARYQDLYYDVDGDGNVSAGDMRLTDVKVFYHANGPENGAYAALNGLAHSPSGDVLAVGDSGAMVLYDGSQGLFVNVSHAEIGTGYNIWGAAYSSGVWVVIAWNKSFDTPAAFALSSSFLYCEKIGLDEGNGNHLFGVAAWDRTVLMVGELGTLIVYDSVTKTVTYKNANTAQNLNCVGWKWDGTEAVVGGNNGVMRIYHRESRTIHNVTHGFGIDPIKAVGVKAPASPGYSLLLKGDLGSGFGLVGYSFDTSITIPLSGDSTSPQISNFDILVGAQSKKKGMVDAGSTLSFYIDAYFAGGWENVDIWLDGWYDGGVMLGAGSSPPPEDNGVRNSYFNLSYSGSSGVWSINFPTPLGVDYMGWENEFSIMGYSESSAVEVDGYEHHYLALDLNISPQARAANPGAWDDWGDLTPELGFANLNTWDVRLQVYTGSSVAARYTEFGVYRYIGISASGSPTGSAAPGQETMLHPKTALSIISNTPYNVTVEATDLLEVSDPGLSIAAENIYVQNHHGERWEGAWATYGDASGKTQLQGAGQPLRVWGTAGSPYLPPPNYGTTALGQYPGGEMPEQSAIVLGSPDLGLRLSVLENATVTNLAGTWGIGDGAYLDMDNSGDVSVGDIRIVTPGYSYLPGTNVKEGDADLALTLYTWNTAKVTGPDGLWDPATETVYDSSNDYVETTDFRVTAFHGMTILDWWIYIPPGTEEGRYVGNVLVRISHGG